MRDIKIDHVANTIVITKTFAAAASNPSSEECLLLNQVKAANPTMSVVINARKSTKTKSCNKGLTYKFMRSFISIMDAKNLENFNKAILYYEALHYSNNEVYWRVKEWFESNYPKYQEMIVDAAPKKVAFTEVIVLSSPRSTS